MIKDGDRKHVNLFRNLVYTNEESNNSASSESALASTYQLPLKTQMRISSSSALNMAVRVKLIHKIDG